MTFSRPHGIRETPERRTLHSYYRLQSHQWHLVWIVTTSPALGRIGSFTCLPRTQGLRHLVGWLGITDGVPKICIASLCEDERSSGIMWPQKSMGSTYFRSDCLVRSELRLSHRSFDNGAVPWLLLSDLIPLSSTLPLLLYDYSSSPSCLT